MSSQTYRSIAKVTGAHGLQGSLIVRGYDFDPAWVGAVKRVWLQLDANLPPTEYAVTRAEARDKSVRLKLSGITSRTQAETFVGAMVLAQHADLPALQPDEFYADSLEGMTVRHGQTDAVLGEVIQVLSATAGDYLDVRPVHEGPSVLVPFQTVFVPKIDADAKTVYVQGLDELFAPPVASTQ